MLTSAEWQAVRVTLLVATAGVAISLPPAIALGYLLAKREFRGKLVVETICHLPLVLPPVVTGWLLLLLLGRRGWLGGMLEQQLGLRLVFDWKGAALAAAVMGFPLMLRPIRQAFAAEDDRLVQAARTLGASPWDAFWSITAPLALPGVLSGLVLAFARGLGEFGATLMIAGSIPGETRTIALTIYSQFEVPGGGEQSHRLIGVSVAIAAAALLAGDWLERRGRAKLQGRKAEEWHYQVHLR